MDNRPIGIFDSGVGGLNVLKEIVNIVPNENYIYIGDTINFPYGNKSKESIINISKEIVNYLISKDVKMIVVACGTATSQALLSLQTSFNIPIIGIIKPTVENTIKGSIKNLGIIATRGTIRSKSWDEAILNKDKSINIVSIEAPLLAPLAEEGWVDNKVAELTIQEYLKPLNNIKLDKLILGCTHYPMFKRIISNELPNTQIIDTGIETAIYLGKHLKNLGLNNDGNNVRTLNINFTDVEHSFIKMAKILLNDNSLIVNKIDI